MREFQEDFAAISEAILKGTSISRRPDAISLDYLTAYSPGPRYLQQPQWGLLEVPWRVRYINGEFQLSRPNLEGTDWAAPALTVPFPDVVECDLAFTQLGDPVICLEASGGVIWLYWFDPRDSEFVFTMIGPGRTPRLLLDNPTLIEESDVQLFYVDPQENSVVQREQRDRYEDPYPVPITDVENVYLEDVFRTADYRVAILYSVRDPHLGRYSGAQIQTTLFPVQVTLEGLQAQGRVVGVELRVLIFEVEVTTESISAGASCVEIELEGVLSEYDVLGEFVTEELNLALAIEDLLIVHETVNESLTTSAHVVDGLLIEVLIVRETIPEELTAQAHVHDITLVVV